MESNKSEQARIHLQIALGALQSVSNNNLAEVSSLRVPTPTICSIIQAIAILFRIITKVDGTNESSWDSVKSILRPFPEFINKLRTFHENNPMIELNVRNAVLNTLGSEMTERIVKSNSIVCAELFVWITNLMKYYELCGNGQ